MEAYGYIRVSTNMQSEDGISLDTQTKKIQEYCSYKHINLKHVYSDAGKSGGSMDRPALQELLNTVSENQYVIVAELSRLSRNTKDALNILENIQKKKAFLVSLNPDIDFSSPIGEMMFTILLSFHQLERKQISERVSSNMKNLSSINQLRGRSPFGWKFISKEEPMQKDDGQQNVILIIKDLYEKENNYSQIADYLNKNNYNKYLSPSCKDKNKKNNKDKIFYAQTVKNIISDIGLIETKRKKISNRFLDTRKKSI
jgi:site-specific DNA recombinase